MTVQIILIIVIPLLMIYSTAIFCYGYKKGHTEGFNVGIKALENQKALGEEMRKIRDGINDENVLFGFNMAIAICNKYLGE